MLRTVTTQTEPFDIGDCVHVSQFGECYHTDRKCHGLRNASRVRSCLDGSEGTRHGLVVIMQDI